MSIPPIQSENSVTIHLPRKTSQSQSSESEIKEGSERRSSLKFTGIVRFEGRRFARPLTGRLVEAQNGRERYEDVTMIVDPPETICACRRLSKIIGSLFTHALVAGIAACATWLALTPKPE